MLASNQQQSRSNCSCKILSENEYRARGNGSMDCHLVSGGWDLLLAHPLDSCCSCRCDGIIEWVGLICGIANKHQVTLVPLDAAPTRTKEMLLL
jgi:hypothetical protein